MAVVWHFDIEKYFLFFLCKIVSWMGSFLIVRHRIGVVAGSDEVGRGRVLMQFWRLRSCLSRFLCFINSSNRIISNRGLPGEADEDFANLSHKDLSGRQLSAQFWPLGFQSCLCATSSLFIYNYSYLYSVNN